MFIYFYFLLPSFCSVCLCGGVLSRFLFSLFFCFVYFLLCICVCFAVFLVVCLWFPLAGFLFAIRSFSVFFLSLCICLCLSLSVSLSVAVFLFYELVNVLDISISFAHFNPFFSLYST